MTVERFDCLGIDAMYEADDGDYIYCSDYQKLEAVIVQLEENLQAIVGVSLQTGISTIARNNHMARWAKEALDYIPKEIV